MVLHHLNYLVLHNPARSPWTICYFYEVGHVLSFLLYLFTFSSFLNCQMNSYSSFKAQFKCHFLSVPFLAFLTFSWQNKIGFTPLFSLASPMVSPGIQLWFSEHLCLLKSTSSDFNTYALAGSKWKGTGMSCLSCLMFPSCLTTFQLHSISIV